jgi:twitching motility two-component system response regulator PilG
MSHHILHVTQGIRKITLNSFAYEYDTKQRVQVISSGSVYEKHIDTSVHKITRRRGFSPVASLFGNTDQNSYSTVPVFGNSDRNDFPAVPLCGNTNQNAYPALSPAKKCIFIIDDSLTVQKIVETTLRQAGYETRAFSSGIDALRYLTEPGACRPDLIFVDISLPKLDGYQVIQIFKKKPEFAHVIYIVLSRRDGLVDRLKGRLAGAQAYITKPFTTQALVTAVQTYLTRGSEFDEPNQ